MVRRLSAVGGYVAAGLALVVFWLLERAGLMARTPYWLLVTFLFLSCVADVAGRIAQRRWPGSIICDRVRLAAAAVTTALVLYATGWGSLLTIGFGVGATQVLAQSHRPDWRWAYACNFGAVACGEVAVGIGVAPSLIGVGLGHAVALLGVLCLAVMLWILGEALAARDTNQRLVLEREERLVVQATTDFLTGLANRSEFMDRLTEACGSGTPIAVAFIDLDRFKEVNDTLGHHSGDAVLVEVASRLRRSAREGDLIARLGGDEFGLLLPGVDRRAARNVLDRIRGALIAEIEIDGVPVSAEASIGTALFPEDATEMSELMQCADIAMYASKDAQAGVVEYSLELQHHSRARLALVSQLRRAIESDELVLHYQPKIELRTGEVRSVEALIRWAHPTLGLLPPSEFLQIAESTGLIGPLTDWVIDNALQQIARWRDDSLPLAVAINVSARDLCDQTLPDRIFARLDALRIEHGLLQVEITETAVVSDPPRAVATLQRLREGRVRVSLDDFGQGYSSLAHLARLPLDELKIDRSFIANMTTNPNERAIVRAVIELGHHLGLEVVAEGIDSVDLLEALSAWGCDAVQGYALTVPLPAADVAGWIRARNAGPRSQREKAYVEP
jgi:diguanylate cyclase (GGDEF)-like protein